MQLEIIIDQLILAKTKCNIILLSVEISIDISRHFIHVLSFSVKKFELDLSIWQDLSKIPYND